MTSDQTSLFKAVLRNATARARHQRRVLLERVRSGSLRDPHRVFCISVQRTGTTSVGKFLRDAGYRCAGWSADMHGGWSDAWLQGDYDHIFDSAEFKLSNAFEDSPWFFPDFYKVLYHRFPTSRFILIQRDSKAWFRSMVKHSNGEVLGKANVHMKIYRRELEYLDHLASGSLHETSENTFNTPKELRLDGLEDHYTQLYELHYREARRFFAHHSPESLFEARLEDPDKWAQLARFLNVDVRGEWHENASR